MDFLIQTQDFIIFGIGILVGWILHSLVDKIKTKVLVKTLVAIAIFSVWIFNNVTGDGGNIFLNLMVGILVAQFFELKTLKGRLVNMIGNNNDRKN